MRSFSVIALLILVAIGCFAWAALAPLGIPSLPSGAIALQDEVDVSFDSQDRTSAADFGSSLSRMLQVPLIEPVEPVHKPITTQRLPELRISLIGTVVEDNRLVAILKTASGAVQFKSIGESIGEPAAELLEISNEAVTFQYGGKQVVVKLSKT